MKVLIIIPARKGSKGLRNKNFLKIGSRSLIEHSCIFSKKLNFAEKTIISSDSKKAEIVAKKFGILFSKRPRKLARDNSLMIDLVRFEIKKNKGFTHVLILQPTCPFRKKEIFFNAYQKLKNKKLDSIFTIRQVNDHPNKMIVKKGEFFNAYDKSFNFNNRQKLKKVFIRSGSMYFFNIKNIKKYGSIIGKKFFCYEVKNKYSINIDYLEDLKLARTFL